MAKVATNSPGVRLGGRQKGTPNKVTSNIKTALTDAFDNLGGVPSLVKWGRENQGEFYKLWAKLVPKDVQVGGEGGGPIEVTVRIAREGRRVTAG